LIVTGARRLDGAVQPDRVMALSEQLVQVHQGLRDRLAGLRQQAAAGGPEISAGAGLGPGDLLGHCLGFCRAVQAHHTGEDTGLFPALQAAAPELTPVIVKLAEDHTLVAGILQQVRELLAQPAGPDTLRRELDGLTAILESHFAFEERRLAAALDALGPDDRFPAVFTLPPPG
jgi:Hemerythrin HHE cation binding domain